MKTTFWEGTSLSINRKKHKTNENNLDETNDVSSNSSTDTEDDDFQESKAQALRRELEEQKILSENLNNKFMLAEFDQTYENPKEEDIVQLPQDIAHELVDDKVNEISDNIQKENWK